MVRAAVLQSGRTLTAEAVVNAAGTWAADLACAAGITLPVEPMRRYVHDVETTADLGDLPFIKDVPAQRHPSRVFTSVPGALARSRSRSEFSPFAACLRLTAETDPTWDGGRGGLARCPVCSMIPLRPSPAAAP